MKRCHQFLIRRVWLTSLGALGISTISGSAILAQQGGLAPGAPAARRGADSSVYFGVVVRDPYRRMEDIRSAETRQWIQAQDKAARAFTATWAARDSARAAIDAGSVPLMSLVPFKEGGRYFFTRTRNTGPTQAYSLLVKTTRDATPRPVIDDGMLAKESLLLRRVAVAPDGKTVAYGVSKGELFTETIHVRDIDADRDLSDRIEGLTGNSYLVWARLGPLGFFYTRLTPPERLDSSGSHDHPRLMYHRLGTPQSQDELVFERPDHPEWVFTHWVSDDGRYLVITARIGIERRDRIFVRDLTVPGSRVVPIAEDGDAELDFLGSAGHVLWFVTDYRAPNRKIIAIDVNAPQRANWRDLVPESKDAIDTWSSRGGARAMGDRLLVLYRSDAVLVARIFDNQGTFLYNLQLPRQFNSIWSTGGRQGDSEGFYIVQNVVDPGTVYSLDAATGKSTIFDRPPLPYNPDDFLTEQVFYTSRDGTRVPMYVMRHKDTPLDGTAPGIVYGYGFDAWSGSPWFQPMVTEFLRRGGVWALANIRGGGEYGTPWAEAGRRRNKQTSIDDYLAAAEWLQASKYVARGKLVANSSSAGGMMAAAAIQERPDLFAAAILDYPVVDMFRYHLFSGGARWAQEYGTVNDAADFKALLAYAPLQKVHPGTCYPATLIAPGEIDQVATPMHAYKFAAALQHANANTGGCRNPILLRVSWGGGHSAGATSAAAIDNWADQIAFIFQAVRREEGGK